LTESLNGLRFDIYERVQLPEEMAAIEELEEIELVPHMQAIPLDDQVILKGHLLLTGSYRSHDERSAASQLEHWIPVEISLPSSRVEKLDDLAVEIDNFDVDLLSARSLNVTGVLGLRGLQVAPPQTPVWREDGFTVVHQALQPSAESYAEEPFPNRGPEFAVPPQPNLPHPPQSYPWLESFRQDHQEASPPQGTEPLPSAPGYETRDPIGQGGPFGSDGSSGIESQPAPAPYGESQPAYGADYGQPEEASYRPLDSGHSESSSPNADSFRNYWGDISARRSEPEPQPKAEPNAGLKPEPKQELKPEFKPELKAELKPELKAEPKSEPKAPVHKAIPIVEEKSDFKVGLSSSPPPEKNVTHSGSGVGLLSHLGDKASKREAEAFLPETKIQHAPPPTDASSETSGDEIEWTRLFLSNESASPSFRKVKLCIVQREDTLEAIATRYNVQSRELQLYNRLIDPHVQEGQILYIPT
jgi:stage VI sporulation protein D